MPHHQPNTGAKPGTYGNPTTHNTAGMPLKVGERRIAGRLIHRIVNRQIQTVDPQTMKEGEK
jgi:hypothetical protein